MKKKTLRPRQRGAVIVLFALALVVIFGGAGLSFDIARMYMTRSEDQAFADAAALAAVAKLNGTIQGIAEARTAAVENWKQHSFSNTQYVRPTDNSGDITVLFCTSYPCGPGVGNANANPDPATSYRFAYVRAEANVPLYLLPLVTGRSTTRVVAHAVAGQVKQGAFGEGTFPFGFFERPLANGDAPSDANDWGMVQDEWYTFAWGLDAEKIMQTAFSLYGFKNGAWLGPSEFLDPSNTYAQQALNEIGSHLRTQETTSNGKKRKQWCPGDTYPNFLKNVISQLPSAFVPDPSNSIHYPGIIANAVLRQKGFYSLTNEGTDYYRDWLLEGYQGGDVYAEGTAVYLPNGQREALTSPIIYLTRTDRNQEVRTNGMYDLDGNAVTGGTNGTRWYFHPPNTVEGAGSGQRLVVAPVLSSSGTVSSNSSIRAFRSFLLLVDECKGNCGADNKYYDAPTSTDNWCAAFQGDALEPIGTNTPANNGIFVIRLVE